MRFLFRLFNKNQKSDAKLHELEKRIVDLEKELKSHFTELNKDSKNLKEKEASPTINIEHLQVDKIIIEKLDYANNFGQLGIKDLSGKLNIGTSYEGDISKLIDEKLEKKVGPKEAKVQIRSKKEPI
ncbi:MAG: hypothetical protein Q8934_03120 [Bacillota bacterium]|nr:hypothetical protein [Bacillota bacterium]